MITVNDYFKEVRDCIYKNEVYSVRDNGAVMRHSRQNKRVRKYDNVWTFGKIDEKGYCIIGIERVHRIVAFAFLGEPPSPQHVVDHIDTNRQNNRPENLRWLTRLENALNNEITRKRIENICGSIEVFIKNPAILHGHEKIDPNFKWMRAVSPNEAKAAYDNLTKWAKEKPSPKGGKLDEWVYYKQKSSLLNKRMLHEMTKEIQKKKLDSKTPNVVQVKWRTPTEFPLCPQEQYSEPLEEYKKRLNPGVVFSRNYYNESIVVDAEFVEGNDTLLVLCKGTFDGENAWYLVKVTYQDNLFYHKSIFAYFNETEAKEVFASIKDDIQILYDLEDYF